MWRREARYRIDVRLADADPGPEETVVSAEQRIGAWARWEEKWSRPEEERVARWLGVRGGDQVVPAEVPAPEELWRGTVTADLKDRSESGVQREERQSPTETLETVRDALEAEVANLQEQRDRLVESAEAAAAAAERARLAEREAVARMEAAQERARKVEAQQFEIWEALESEVTALERRRQQLNGAAAADGG